MIFDPMDKQRLKWKPQELSTREAVAAAILLIVFVSLVAVMSLVSQIEQGIEVTPIEAIPTVVQDAPSSGRSAGPIFIK